MAALASRFAIPDILRGVAITAMLVAHGMPFIPHLHPDVRQLVEDFMMGQPMFALVMGISLQLLWRQRIVDGEAAGKPRGRIIATVLAQQAVRVVVLIALGLWMAQWGSWVAVVLAFLGVALIAATPLLLLPTRVLIPVAVVCFVAIQPVTNLARAEMVESTDWLGRTFWMLVGASPYYHPVSFVTIMMIGALLTRHGFERDRTLAVVFGGAFVLFSAGLVAKDADLAPAGTYLDSMRDIGAVLLVYVIVVWIATSKHPIVLTPFADAGRVSLSLYIAHVAFIAWYVTTYGSRPEHDVWWAWAICVPGMLLLGIAWWRFVGTGPFETVLTTLMGRPKHPRHAIRAARAKTLQA